MSRPFLIALYSREPRSGKSEVAKVLKDHGYIVESFAEPIKAMLAVVLGRHGYTAPTIERMLYGDLKNHPIEEFGGKDPRFLLETLGTKWGRETVHPSLWIGLLRGRLIRHSALGRRVVIDDLRRPDEYRMLRSLGALFVRIDRPGAPFDTASNEGLLEAERFDKTILNDGSRVELHEAAKELGGPR